MNKKLIIGIDFGTTNTVVTKKYADDERIEFITDDNCPLIPSAVFKSNDGVYSYGIKAIRKRVNQGDNLYTYFKSGLLSDDIQEFKSSCQLTQLFIKYVYDLISLWIEQDKFDEFAIMYSYPAIWKEKQITVLHNAIRNAGFKGALTHFTEPEAGIFYSMFLHKDEIIRNKIINCDNYTNVMILDLGAGTADISLSKSRLNDKGYIEFVDLQNYPQDSNNRKIGGGDELDTLLHNYLIKQYFNGKETKYYQKIHTKKWKEDYLSDYINQKTKDIPEPANLPFYFDNFNFDEEVFLSITEDYWRKLHDIIKSSVKEYKKMTGIGEEDIDLIILSGGHSQWRMVQDFFISEKFGFHFVKVMKQPNLRLIQERMPEAIVGCGLTVIDNDVRYESFVDDSYWADLYIDNEKQPISLILNSGRSFPVSETATIAGIGTSMFGTESFKIKVELRKGKRYNDSVFFKSFEFSHSNTRLLTFAFFGVGFFREDYEIRIPITIKGSNSDDLTFNIDDKLISSERIAKDNSYSDEDSTYSSFWDDPYPY